MAYSVTSTKFSLACICILICSAYPNSVHSKPARTSTTEQTERELNKTDMNTPAFEENLAEHETKVTERPPDNLKKTKHADSAKLAEQENEGMVEKMGGKSSKSKEDASTTFEKEQREKVKVQKKKSESVESTSEDFPEYQEHSAADVGFEAIFSKGRAEGTPDYNDDDEASNNVKSDEGEVGDSRTAAKREDKSSKREKTAGDGSEPLPSAERQRGKMPDTTPSPATTTGTAPSKGSSATSNIPRAFCSFALALAAVFAAL